MIKPDLWLVIFAPLLVLLILWLILWSSRRSIVYWIIRRIMARGELAKAETIILEARSEKWISLLDEVELRHKYNLEHRPEMYHPDQKPEGPAEHLQDLWSFFFHKKEPKS